MNASKCHTNRPIGIYGNLLIVLNSLDPGSCGFDRIDLISEDMSQNNLSIVFVNNINFGWCFFNFENNAVVLYAKL